MKSCFNSSLALFDTNQPLSLWKPPLVSKLTNICHQFTRTRLSRIRLLTRAAACRVFYGCLAFTANQRWRMSRRSEPFQTGLTWKITWLQQACNFKWLWLLIISWSTSFIPVSLRSPMLIWDLWMSESFDLIPVPCLVPFLILDTCQRTKNDKTATGAYMVLSAIGDTRKQPNMSFCMKCLR